MTELIIVVINFANLPKNKTQNTFLKPPNSSEQPEDEDVTESLRFLGNISSWI